MMVSVLWLGPPEVSSWISAKHWKELMVVMTRMYRVVGMMAGHLIFQKHWKSVAPSTSAASTMDWSTLPRAETYRTMGWPTEVVSRMRMMQPERTAHRPAS